MQVTGETIFEFSSPLDLVIGATVLLMPPRHPLLDLLATLRQEIGGVDEGESGFFGERG
ncbi:hypothetical protein [Bradyrhizobium sp. USDA 4471]